MNKLWTAMVIICSIAAIWFSGLALKQIWNYSHLRYQVIADIRSWSVISKAADKYFIEAEYIFKYQGKEYSGKTIFQKPVFLNELSAKNAIKNIKNRPWTVWFDPKSPKISSLQKLFPFKACINSLLSIIITIYFAFLGKFVQRNAA